MIEMENIFEQICEIYGESMKNVAYQILNDDYLAEDALQESYISIFTNIDKYSFTNIEDNNFKNFLFRIVKNKACTIYTQRKAKNEITIYDNLVSYDNILSIFDKSNEEELILIIEKQLSEKLSLVFKMKYVYGYNNDEIALKLNITNDNVRKRLERARTKLKQNYCDILKCML